MDTDINAIAVSYINMKQENLQGAIQTSILRKVMDQNTAQAQQLLNTLTKPTPSIPLHVGNHVDRFI
ncbi:YjfB family protein [Pelotomaculum propionicicum]|uniref:YjfB family protein n=1 Tax=Pelotomaculum propionicicum TaxID=258475 RepID=UPI003B7DA494